MTARRQQGQALIYGLFVLVGGLATLMFLFNTGQLTGEKTKLVNTADAVAYSAGVMHARALNFDAYTNRALMANEVMIAQAVSIASWAHHVPAHTENIDPLLCRTYYSRPVALALRDYIPVCYLLSFPVARTTANGLDKAVQVAARETVALAEAAKSALQGAQSSMADSLPGARRTVMQQVADANYLGDGEVRVDSLPITDNFSSPGGKPFIERYAGADRGRMKSAVIAAAEKDAFVKKRFWTAANGFPCMMGNKAEYRRRGGTELVGFDEWKAMDTASLHEWRWKPRGLLGAACDEAETALGYATQTAGAGSADDSAAGFGNSRQDNPDASSAASGSTWTYSGLPAFYDLSGPAIGDSASASGPRLRFSVRLTRAKSQAKTSEGSSAVKPAGRLARFDANPASGVLAAVATSEVFFLRPVPRGDGKTELASLFNPYWQVHLVPNTAADVAAAMARGGPQ